MKTYTEFLEEAYGTGKRGWKPNTGTEEHDEVEHQKSGDLHPSIRKAMNHLSDPKNYAQALQRSKVSIYNRRKMQNVHNTDAGESWIETKKTLDPEKVSRVEKQSRGIKTMPIIIKAKNKKTGETVSHLLGGNTRASKHAGEGVPVQVIHYEHD